MYVDTSNLGNCVTNSHRTNPKMLSSKSFVLFTLWLSLSSSFQLTTPTILARKASAPTALFASLTQGDNTPTPTSAEISRRAAFVTSAILSAGGMMAANPSVSNAAAPITEQVKAIENANFIGMIGKPIYTPNVSGDPAKHLPQVNISEDRTVTVTIPHVMKTEHYIQFIWLKDAKTNEVVLVKAFPEPKEDTPNEPPTLVAKVPEGVSLQPCLFCNLHGLWKGEAFDVA